MPTVLLDTDIVSFILKGDTRSLAYAPLIQGNVAAVSFMTVAELFQWAAVRKWGIRRRVQLEHALSAYLIVPVDIEMCRIWGSDPSRTTGRRAKYRTTGRMDCGNGSAS